jgi:hypothetical protein
MKTKRFLLTVAALAALLFGIFIKLGEYSLFSTLVEGWQYIDLVDAVILLVLLSLLTLGSLALLVIDLVKMGTSSWITGAVVGALTLMLWATPSAGSGAFTFVAVVLSLVAWWIGRAKQ